MRLGRLVFMKRVCLLVVLAAVILIPALSKKPSPFVGRWDLSILTPQGTYPSWIEVSEANRQAQVRIVGRVSSVHAAVDARIHGSTLTFASSEWFGHPIQVEWKINLEKHGLKGIQQRADGVTGNLSGERAPELDRKAPAAWGEPESLFDGNDLTGWEPDGPKNFWKAEKGELVDGGPGANLRTTKKFEDFKLHIEYNCPDKGNSGVYLRGRYEVQVEYEPADANDKFHGMGSLYGFIAPSQELPKRPGEWESYDITLVGRHVTVVRDGVSTIDNQEIPGITGGAIDSKEGDPGPIYLQGDHTGNMRYRNIRISLPKP